LRAEKSEAGRRSFFRFSAPHCAREIRKARFATGPVFIPHFGPRSDAENLLTIFLRKQRFFLDIDEA
jgi:hypothetical protein